MDFMALTLILASSQYSGDNIYLICPLAQEGSYSVYDTSGELHSYNSEGDAEAPRSKVRLRGDWSGTGPDDTSSEGPSNAAVR